eukprot:CAMPEP_0198419598 /NCGR_PEP_ID=MMETSP1452-20131203/324_1 /TAXON_ID=1181717 /ORGANISM="Synchroma pusillum, Strain CCMP3072" /LENGTH=30 /DNA_ID= /DNA_START= /DNA_END= /DNA_ORIENTATION=
MKRCTGTSHEMSAPSRLGSAAMPRAARPRA